MNNEIIGRIYRTLFRAYNRHADVTNYDDEYESGKLKQSTNEINELYKKWPWFRRLGKDFLIKK